MRAPMKTGDIVTDSRAAAWTLGALLGEGAWGRAWVARDDAGNTRVLKAPYEAEDLPPAAADRVPLMRKAAEEAADLLADGPAWLVPLEDRIVLPTGAVALLLPHAPTTLARQLQSGLPLVEALQEIQRVVEALAGSGLAHGNLRPSNILFGPDGRPMLSDPLTPSLKSLAPGAERTTPERKRWSAPDHIANDTWALCSALYTAVMLEEDDRDGPLVLPAPAATGLDKVTLATLRDRAIARLRRDGANPRFISRTAERLAKVLARGLSGRADPSPPYRFLKAKDLQPRLAEVNALVHPGIESVGRLLLSSHASGEVFDAPGPVGFTVSVGPTEGVTDPDDLVCGVRLTDLDAQGDGRVPLKDAQFAVNKHPSGRFRFEFNIPDVEPGRYEVRVAFSVKDAGDEPVVAEGRFQVRPPPGYVPPARETEGPALSFPPTEARLTPLAASALDDDEDDDDMATVVMPHGQRRPAPVTDVTDPDEEEEDRVVQMFPRPLAPTSPGTQIDEAPAPPISAPAPLPPPTPSVRPSLAAVPTPPPSEPGSAISEVDEGPPGPPVVSPPRPSLTLAAPQITEPPQPSPLPVQPTPVAAPPPVVPTPGIGQPPAWQDPNDGNADFFGAEGVPGGGEDLVTEPRPNPLASIQEALGDFGRPDSPLFFAVVVAGCCLLVLVTLLLTSSC